MSELHCREQKRTGKETLGISGERNLDLVIDKGQIEEITIVL